VLGLIVASKHSIDTGAGVIDADYRGPVKVLLFNYSDEDFTGELFGSFMLLSAKRTRSVNNL